jgi:enamine deaminase RidA (YjgF/YER057c/UK114 family)
LSGQASPSVGQSLDKLKSALTGAGMEAADALAVTCFVSSLDDQRDTRQAMAASFPSAALNYAQMQRGPVTPAANCEAIARLRSAPARPVTFAPDSQMVLVSSPQVVITGTQLAFGNQDSDFKLAFERLEKTLAASKTRFDHAVMVHLYVTANRLSGRVRAIQLAEGRPGDSPASTLVPFESLPSLDALFGIDVIAVPVALTDVN